jgi:hypothetical protein
MSGRTKRLARSVEPELLSTGKRVRDLPVAIEKLL